MANCNPRHTQGQNKPCIPEPSHCDVAPIQSCSIFDNKGFVLIILTQILVCSNLFNENNSSNLLLFLLLFLCMC